jgi:hypothetical protein
MRLGAGMVSAPMFCWRRSIFVATLIIGERQEDQVFLAAAWNLHQALYSSVRDNPLKRRGMPSTKAKSAFEPTKILPKTNTLVSGVATGMVVAVHYNSKASYRNHLSLDRLDHQGVRNSPLWFLTESAGRSCGR